MEQDPDSPPTFWLQPPRATNRRRAPPIDPVVLIILIPILALIFLFFSLPPFLSHTSHILSNISKPGSVKSTWDSLNIFLVLFAILCGVLARQNDDAPSSSSDVSNGFVTEGSSSSSSGGQSSGQWTGFSDRKVVPGGLRRNSSSYPNLRNESVWESENRNQNRFFDDFNLYSSPANRYYNYSQRTENMYRPVELSGEIHRRSRRSEADRDELTDEKEIFVDTFEVSSNTPEFQQSPATPPPPPPPPPRSAPAVNSKRHSFRSVAKNVTVEVPQETESDVFDEMRSSSYAPPPPPPPPPPPQSTEVKVHRSRNKHKKLERKVSDATKEIATAISSLYNQRKRKNKRKLRNDSGGSDTSPPSVHSVRSETEQISQQTPPPPPPPPPPPYRFQNLFKKGGKHKRIHSVPVTVSGRVPPPPPPPPPSSIFNNILKSVSKSKRFHSHSNSHSHSTAPPPPLPPPSSHTNRVSKTESKSKRFNSIFSAPLPPPPLPPPMTPPRYPVKSKQISNRKNESKPPLPTKTNNYYEREEFLPSGSQSPLIPMPPPPPPFKMKAMKFELRGDFVRIQSTHSSVCSSPDRDVDFSSLGMDGGDSIGPGSGLGLGSGPRFHPSPDVNAKAERFISRLKDEWRMEKKNYGKEKMG